MIIEFNKISKSFKSGFWGKQKEILQNFSFSIKRGDLCGFLGVNGAGKSTSLKILFKFIKYDSGSFSLNLKGTNFKEKLLQVGYLPENPNLLKSFTGYETLEYLSNFYSNYKYQKSEATALAESLQIDHAMKLPLASYSKGMLQRISFLSSIIHKPKLLILDEPFSGLDPIGRLEMKNILKKYNKEYETTVLFTSHIVADLEEISNSVIVLKDGTDKFVGPIHDLYEMSPLKEKRVIYKNATTELVSELELENTIKKAFKERKIIDKIENNRQNLEKIIYDI